MPNFQIVDVSKKKAGDPGTWVAYGVTLAPPGDGPQIEAELTQSQNAPPPEVGESGEFTLEESRWGLKAKRPKSGGGGKRFERQPDHPLDAARKGRAHAQGMALRYCHLKQMRGELPDDFKLGPALERIIEWFADDVNAAEPAAKSGPRPNRLSDIPTPPLLPPEPVGDTSDLPF